MNRANALRVLPGRGPRAAGCADRADRGVVTCGIAGARKKKKKERGVSVGNRRVAIGCVPGLKSGLYLGERAIFPVPYYYCVFLSLSNVDRYLCRACKFFRIHVREFARDESRALLKSSTVKIPIPMQIIRREERRDKNSSARRAARSEDGIFETRATFVSN